MATAIKELQYPLVALADLSIANIGTGNGYTLSLPAGAVLVDIKAVITTAFNSATTTTLSLSDGTTTFISAEDAKTAGAVAVDRVVKEYASGGTLTISMAETGATASAGAGMVAISYVIVNRQNENRG
jgi:hypothetical protein